MIHVETVVGAQYGSEAKGHVTLQRVRAGLEAREQGIFSPDTRIVNVRVAGPNAGHTGVDRDGNHIALRTIPIGALEEGVDLYIAPGSEVDLDVLVEEIDRLEGLGHSVAERLYISPQVTILEPKHREQEAERSLSAKIGSTGKGIGAARASRIWREATIGRESEDLMAIMKGKGLHWASPEEVYGLGDTLDNERYIVIEGTQGYGLGLHQDDYPRVTSSDCRAIDFMAMAGISPWGVDSISVWLVMRAFPIRVAGDSGSMKGETSWEDLGLPEERTTVTQKVRRVGEWDSDLVRRAYIGNGGIPGQIGGVFGVMTMVDQMFPGVNDEGFDMKPVFVWLDQIQSETGVPILAYTTSPDTIHYAPVGAGQPEQISDEEAMAHAAISDDTVIGEVSLKGMTVEEAMDALQKIADKTEQKDEDN